MLLCDNFDDLLYAIHTDLDCYALYKNKKDETFKIKYIYNDKKPILNEYKFSVELDNTFRLLKTIPQKNKATTIELLQQWYNNNKLNITFLEKKETTLFLMKHQLTESKSCWKSMHGLKKAIEGGLEVPNCIPDSAYALDEGQYFIDAKHRELLTKYKKAKEWFDETIAHGDKEYAEKILKIIEKWKRSYEDKIRTAKTALKEAYDVVYSKNEVDKYLKKSTRTYHFYKSEINNFQEPLKTQLLNKLELWYDGVFEYLQKKKKEIPNSNDKPIEIQYDNFGYINIDECVISNIHQYLSESEFAKSEIQRFITNDTNMNADLQAFKEENGWDKLSVDEKTELLYQFRKNHVYRK